MTAKRSQPALTPPNRLEILRSLRFANIDVAFATAFATLVTGAFMVGFIQSLGGSDIWIGLLSAVPSLVGLLQIPGAIWGRSFGSYKVFVLPGGLLWRVFYVPLPFLPFLPIANELKLVLLAVCVLLASMATMAVNSIYNDWLAEMVPSDSRGVFFARRNAIATATGAAVGLLGAVLLDWFRATGREQFGFTVVFVLGLVCAASSFAMFLQMRDLPRPNPIRQSLWEGVKAIGHPFRDRGYRHVLQFLAIFTVGQVFAGNLFVAFGRESLHLDFKIIQGMVVCHAVGNVLFARFWGFLSDKYGNKPMLMMAGAALALNPLPWILAVPGRDLYNSLLLLGSHVVMGATWSGVALCQFNLMLSTAKPEDRANYLGAGLTVTALTGGIAPLLGATMMNLLRHSYDPATAYKIVFGATAALRVVAMLFLFRVHETGAAPLREALASLRGVTPRGMRAMRSLSRTATATERVEAIEQVGAQGVHLASDALLSALHDPLPSVRRQAAMSLARLHDPRAVDELIHQLEEHPDLLEEEMVEALGILNDPRAIGPLARTLQHPSPLIRRSAAKALGRIAKGSGEAAAPLIVAAQDPNDPDLRRAALQALRAMGASEAAPLFRAALMDPLPSIRIAAAEAVAELRIAEAVEDLRASIERFPDEAASEAAYALGVVGGMDDLPKILDEAAKCASMITRRRCLLGVGHLLGVESSVYRLMLIGGMNRDVALSEMLAQLARRNPRVRVALDRYASGDEAGAVDALAKATHAPELAMLAQRPVAELFLVAASFAARA